MQGELEALIDACCSEASSPDRVHRLGKIEVDLGELPSGDLERILIEKLRPALRQALHEKVRAVELEAARLGEDPAVSARLELISLFARTGTLPYWADASDPSPANDSNDASTTDTAYVG